MCDVCGPRQTPTIVCAYCKTRRYCSDICGKHDWASRGHREQCIGKKPRSFTDEYLDDTLRALGEQRPDPAEESKTIAFVRQNFPDNHFQQAAAYGLITKHNQNVRQHEFLYDFMRGFMQEQGIYPAVVETIMKSVYDAEDELLAACAPVCVKGEFFDYTRLDASVKHVQNASDLLKASFGQVPYQKGGPTREQELQRMEMEMLYLEAKDMPVDPEEDWSFLARYLETGTVSFDEQISGKGDKPAKNKRRLLRDFAADAGGSYEFIRNMWLHMRRKDPGFTLAALGNMLMIYFGKDWIIDSYRFYFRQAWDEVQAIIRKSENQQVLLQALRQQRFDLQKASDTFFPHLDRLANTLEQVPAEAVKQFTLFHAFSVEEPAVKIEMVRQWCRVMAGQLSEMPSAGDVGAGLIQNLEKYVKMTADISQVNQTEALNYAGMLQRLFEGSAFLLDQDNETYVDTSRNLLEMMRNVTRDEQDLKSSITGIVGMLNDLGAAQFTLRDLDLARYGLNVTMDDNLIVRAVKMATMNGNSTWVRSMFTNSTGLGRRSGLMHAVEEISAPITILHRYVEGVERGLTPNDYPGLIECLRVPRNNSLAFGIMAFRCYYLYGLVKLLTGIPAFLEQRSWDNALRNANVMFPEVSYDEVTWQRIPRRPVYREGERRGAEMPRAEFDARISLRRQMVHRVFQVAHTTSNHFGDGIQYSGAICILYGWYQAQGPLLSWASLGNQLKVWEYPALIADNFYNSMTFVLPTIRFAGMISVGIVRGVASIIPVKAKRLMIDSLDTTVDYFRGQPTGPEHIEHGFRRTRREAMGTARSIARKYDQFMFLYSMFSLLLLLRHLFWYAWYNLPLINNKPHWTTYKTKRDFSRKH
jgi:hypothetical protein